MTRPYARDNSYLSILANRYGLTRPVVASGSGGVAAETPVEGWQVKSVVFDAVKTGTLHANEELVVGTSGGQRVAIKGDQGIQAYDSTPTLVGQWDSATGKLWSKSGGFGGSLSSPNVLIDGNGLTVTSKMTVDSNGLWAVAGGFGGTDFASRVVLLNSNGLSVGASGTTIDIDGTNKQVGTSDFASGLKGWRVTAEGDAEFNNIVARGSFRTALFVKDEIHVTGGSMLVATGDTVDADVTGPDSIGGTMTLTVKDGNFANGDIVRLKAVHGASSYDCWFTLSNKSASAPWTYTATLESGTLSAAIKKGDAVASYGTSGDGRILLTSDLADSPYIDIFTHAGAPWSTITNKVRIGNLAGLTDSDFGGALSGYGLYTDNGYFKGRLALQVGSTFDEGTLIEWYESGTRRALTSVYGDGVDVYSYSDTGSGARAYSYWRSWQGSKYMYSYLIADGLTSPNEGWYVLGYYDGTTFQTLVRHEFRESGSPVRRHIFSGYIYPGADSDTQQTSRYIHDATTAIGFNTNLLLDQGTARTIGVATRTDNDGGGYDLSLYAGTAQQSGLNSQDGGKLYLYGGAGYGSAGGDGPVILCHDGTNVRGHLGIGTDNPVHPDYSATDSYTFIGMKGRADRYGVWMHAHLSGALAGDYPLLISGFNESGGTEVEIARIVFVSPGSAWNSGHIWFQHATNGGAITTRYRFQEDGSAYADVGWNTFSPKPPKIEQEMTPDDYLEWALEHARKPVKPMRSTDMRRIRLG
jgi:hypothetical protein